MAVRRLPLSAIALTVALVAGLAPAPARAAGADAERIRAARAHYEQAVSHYNLDELAPALAEFREAYRLKPDPSFLFNIAQCHRRLGENEAALDFYRKYLRSLPDAPNRADVERVIGELRPHDAGDVPPPAVATPPVVATPPAATPPAAPDPAPPSLEATPAARPALALEVSPSSPAPPERPPLYRRWWFWTALGVAVVGAVALTWALTAPDPYSGTLDPGTVNLRVR